MYEAWQEHKRVVAQEARKQARPGASAADLRSVGLVGLWQAAQRYDASLGVAFDTFARPRVRGEMADFLRATFGRSGKYDLPDRLDSDNPPEVVCEDKGLRGVDARDELAHLAKGPPRLLHGRGPDGSRNILWRGRLQSMTAWAGELGMSMPVLSRRIAVWGLEDAMTTPVKRWRRRCA